MISVVIPAYNAGECIARAIDSVLAQTFSDYEIIVVDDGSRDNTAEAVGRYGSKVRYIYQGNAGPGATRNTGIYAAKGEWIAFLDADDEWLANKLQLQMQILSKNPDLRWCGSNFSQALGGNQKPAVSPEIVSKILAGKDYFENYFRDSIRGHFITSMITHTSTLVIRRSVFDEVGLLDTELLRQEDFDMWVRIAFRYPRCGYVAEPMAIAHLELSNPVMTERRLQEKRGVLYRKLIRRHLNLAEQYGCLADFKPFAFVVMRDVLLITLFHSLKADALQTVRQFPELFAWYWRFGTYLLTAFPKVTSRTAQAIAYVAGRLKLDPRVSRRWLHLKASKEKPIKNTT